jgi:hypothetical protein
MVTEGNHYRPNLSVYFQEIIGKSGCRLPQGVGREPRAPTLTLFLSNASYNQ